MTRLSTIQLQMMEQAIFLPMVISILNRDLTHLKEHQTFKLNEPYIRLVTSALQEAQKALYQLKQHLRKEKMKVQQIEHDEGFTTYLFIMNGYEEKHKYFNPRIRHRVEELLTRYFLHQEN
ncbi:MULTISPECIES: hypothetical protein [Bacillus]|uniref:YhjD n=1 Tax=Bacillus pumilus TaxID=1408 RepID=A0A2G8IRL3_BACPU|nr:MULTISPECIES: hypothetical protein [Bacillus]MCC9088935.1 hypothetical protein [Bacillus pumilus]MED1748721.1 hypothetical protein [Bacillus zhangzhouensis]PIK26093.1 hypothetical protein CTV99_14160 [Bacillus pumilus]UUD43652.1 hypothetical protein NPA43_05135 [Bacillus pumilus]